MRVWGIFIAIWIAVAAAYGWLGPAAPEPAKVVEAAARWRMPEYRPAEIEAPLLYLKERQPWGRPPPPPGIAASANVEPEPLTSPNWRILAAVAAGADSYVAVQIDKKPTVELRVGQNLPDGSEIARIESDRLYLNVKGHKRVLRLYPE